MTNVVEIVAITIQEPRRVTADIHESDKGGGIAQSKETEPLALSNMSRGSSTRAHLLHGLLTTIILVALS